MTTPPDSWPAEDELRERLAVIEAVEPHFVGVGEIEHLLLGVLELLESERISRVSGVNALVRLAIEWPAGAIETLEFCLRRLQWPELKSVLEEHVRSGSDFRTRDAASAVLEVFEPEWPNGEIYRTYRT